MKKITYNLSLNEAQNMPIMFRSVCSDYDQETLSWSEGRTYFYMMQFVIDGTGILRCRGREYNLKPGCAFLIAKGVAFEYINLGGLRSALLSTVGSVPEDFMRLHKIDSHVFHQDVDLKKYVGMINDIEYAYYSTSKKSKLSSLAYEIFSEFFSEGTKQKSTINEQVLSYLKQNFMNKITLEEISESVGISVSKLCHDFKKAYGCSVFSKIKELRLNYAKELISSNNNCRIGEVASSCGFDDLSYFCRAYKERFNKTPMEDKLYFLN